MKIKSALSKPFAKYTVRRIRKYASDAAGTQQKVFESLIAGAADTAFGKDHHFDRIRTYEDFIKNVPVVDYEALRPYIDRVKNGEADVLWKGVPIYFCKTSGTTSGTKYIPISKESISNHINSARNAILCYIAETGNADFVDGKMIFLQGSPELDTTGKIPTGRLSGIVAHHVPNYLQKNRMPSYEVNCIDDWEDKVEAIARETVKERMSLISGIPPWVQMYFDKLRELTGKKYIKDIFPDFSLFIYGGVNFAPYRTRMEETIGKRIDSIELYPASEGFIAYQDSQKEPGMMLVINEGIFYEFIPAAEAMKKDPQRLRLQDVELDKNYAIVLNTNAGLWGYLIGDTVKFVSKDPYRIVVTGRIKHFISAFGEHVIAEEVEQAIRIASEATGTEISEFHVAPQVNPPAEELPYHEWFIEAKKLPDDMEGFRSTLDNAMQQKNSYYKDLITGNVLQPLKITLLADQAFNEYMKSQGKLGGQNKLPRLANDRNIADQLIRR